MSPQATLAHAGHGDEFHQSESAQSAQGISLDGDTIRRLDIQVEPLQPRYLDTGIRTTGQIETLPQQRVEVTTPVGESYSNSWFCLGQRSGPANQWRL
ncbi:hypothetical protein NON20_05435 [Synechocystis sp. B12]|nr:hypothetical protein NON20_05435 [Synechocystis sp. B12]